MSDRPDCDNLRNIGTGLLSAGTFVMFVRSTAYRGDYSIVGISFTLGGFGAAVAGGVLSYLGGREIACKKSRN